MTKTKKKSGHPKSGKKLSVPQGKIKGFLGENKFILLAFALPFVIMSIGFACQNVAPFGILKTIVDSVAFQLGEWFPQWGIDVKPSTAAPWGDRQMLVIDLWHQYYPFLVELHEKLQSGGSLLYSWVMGMGFNFIAVMSYYLLSPLNFLSIVVPESWLVEYLALATVIKISCMGMFTAIAFRIITKRNDLSIVVFSMLFAFCAFNMGYYWCVIWLDSVAMLPLCVAGTVALLRDGKYKLFTISLALAIIFNYYIGLFICVGVLFTCIGYECSKWGGILKALKDFVRTLTFTVISLLLTAPITIPTFMALQNCYKQQIGMPKKLDLNVSGSAVYGAEFEDVMIGLGEVVSNLFSFLNPTDRSGVANIACGLICLVLGVLFFCNRKIKLGEKLFCGITCLFLLASCVFRHLDFIWHGFRFPNELPARFSFLLSFLLIYMAYKAYTLIDRSHYLDIIISVLVFVLLTLCYFSRGEEAALPPIVASCIVAGVYTVLILLYLLKVYNVKVLTLILCILVFGEMVATAVIGVDTVTSTTMNGYPQEEQSMDLVLEVMNKMESGDENDLFRVEVTETQSLNDSCLNTYNGVTMFNSMANANITLYLEAMGLGANGASNRYAYAESSPVTNTLLNLKYLITRNGKYYNTDYTELTYSKGNVMLLKNTAYLPMGYVTDTELADFDIEEYTNNPFLMQIDWWQRATGIEEPVYTQLYVKDQGHTSSDILQVTKTEEGVYKATPTDSTTAIHTKFNYYPQEDGPVMVYFKADKTRDKKYKILINDQDNGTRGASRPYIAMADCVEAGDKVSVYCDLEEGKTNNIKVFCYQLNKEVFEKGVEILSQSGLITTNYSDTSIEGTVNAKKDGLFYTTIPYEKGWTAYVDGEKVELTPVANAMLAFPITEGEHTIKLTYIPHGFVPGVIAFVIGVILFALFCYLSSKYMKEHPVKAKVMKFLEPNVPKRVKVPPEPETDELSDREAEADISAQEQTDADISVESETNEEASEEI